MNLWPFGAKRFLDTEAEATHVRAWQFMLRHFGGVRAVRAAPMVQPTRTYFTASDAIGEQRAAHIFGDVRRLAGLESVTVRLEAQEPHPDSKLGEFVVVKFAESQAAGTFSNNGDETVITYDPASVNDPFKLVATLAHELAHVKLHPLRGTLPDGEDSYEPMTDLMTVFMGFGLFGANCAFHFSQHRDPISQGWQSQTLGYLSERDWCFGLAVFLAIRNESVDQLQKYLKAHLYRDVKSALAYIQRDPGFGWTRP